MTLLARLGVIAVVALGATSCTAEAPDSAPADGGAPVVQLGAPGESNKTLSPDEVDELSSPTHTDADVAFIQQMIPHHQQALDLTALVEDRARDRDLALVSERIEISQIDEIKQMKDWLSSRQPAGGAPEQHGDHDHETMPGMLTPEELEKLEATRGAEFDRLFLQSMIRHHEGAIRMVETLLKSSDGGQESQVFQIATHVASDQAVEIASMKQLLTELER